jgi:hypothetical protein
MGNRAEENRTTGKSLTSSDLPVFFGPVGRIMAIFLICRLTLIRWRLESPRMLRNLVQIAGSALLG